MKTITAVYRLQNGASVTITAKVHHELIRTPYQDQFSMEGGDEIDRAILPPFDRIQGYHHCLNHLQSFAQRIDSHVTITEDGGELEMFPYDPDMEP